LGLVVGGWGFVLGGGRGGMDLCFLKRGGQGGDRGCKGLVFEGTLGLGR